MCQHFRLRRRSIILLAWRNIRNHVDQFCHGCPTCSDSRNALSNNRSDLAPAAILAVHAVRDSCSRCVYGVHARPEFSDSHDRTASYDRGREQPAGSRGKGRATTTVTRRSPTSVLRYIAAGDDRRILLENNRTSMPSGAIRNGCIIDHWPLSVASPPPCARKRHRESSVSAGNVTCRGYIATSEASVFTHDDVK